jgi:hypothetical protein
LAGERLALVRFLAAVRFADFLVAAIGLSRDGGTGSGYPRGPCGACHRHYTTLDWTLPTPALTRAGRWRISGSH